MKKSVKVEETSTNNLYQSYSEWDPVITRAVSWCFHTNIIWNTCLHIWRRPLSHWECSRLLMISFTVWHNYDHRTLKPWGVWIFESLMSIHQSNFTLIYPGKSPLTRTLRPTRYFRFRHLFHTGIFTDSDSSRNCVHNITIVLLWLFVGCRWPEETMYWILIICD